MNQATFEQQIYETWAQNLECSAETFQQIGTTLRPLERYCNRNMIQFYVIGQHTFVECNPDFIDVIKTVWNSQEVLHIEQVVPLFAGYPMELEATSLIYHLYPPNLQEVTPKGNFLIRVLSTNDQAALDKLFEACTQADVEEAEVSTDHELAYGTFDGDKMVAIASMYGWHGFADPGVLTHPDYRGIGLGKAVVAEICKDVIQQGRLMVYRCAKDNPGSNGVAKSLGFTPYFTNDGLWD